MENFLINGKYFLKCMKSDGERAEGRNIHIMSAGKGLESTFQTAIKVYPVGGVVIVTDVDIEEHHDNTEKSDIVESVRSVQETCRRVDWPCEVIVVPHGSLELLRDRVMDLYIRNPENHYFFNVTNGNKILSLGLFMISIWIGGEAYYIDKGKVKGSGKVLPLGVPKMHLEDVLSNPNYERVLRALLPGDMPMKDLYPRMQDGYQPYREGDKKAKRSLSRGTLSKWVARLEGWGLVEVVHTAKNRKDKIVGITGDGRFAIRYIEASRARSSAG